MAGIARRRGHRLTAFTVVVGFFLAAAATCAVAHETRIAKQEQAGAQAKSHKKSQAKSPPRSPAKPKLDHSGRKRVGEASFYAKKFAGRKMADGKPMNPKGRNAASKTLPLGTKAKVTNLETGQSAVVDIQDRGPYVKGRIVDLSPSTAKKIGIGEEEGVAPVEVAPLAVPQPDGSIKPGAGVQDGP